MTTFKLSLALAAEKTKMLNTSLIELWKFEDKLKAVTERDRDAVDLLQAFGKDLGVLVDALLTEVRAPELHRAEHQHMGRRAQELHGVQD